jgi:hypothetical protein
MKRRDIFLLFVLTAVLFSAVSNGVSAKNPQKGQAEVVNSGLCGDSVQWNFTPESGVLVISGIGAMSNYQFPSIPIPWKRTSIDSLVIEEGVTEIGDYAFYYCENLRSISLPTSLTRIGAFAFTGCNGIDSIDIPASVRSIEHSAFCYCRNIQSLNIQSDSIEIAPFAFSFSDNLKESAYSYMSEGRHISSCAFFKMLDLEDQRNDAEKTSEADIEKSDSIQMAADSIKMQLFEKIEIITPNYK